MERASISAVVFSGQLVGGFFWGPMADRYGRKRAFLCACVVIVTAGLLSGTSTSLEMLLTFRAFVGFGVGGLTVPFDLLLEFLPINERGKYLLYIEYFWTMGSLFVSGVAWALLDVIGWRGLAYLITVPVFLCSALSIMNLPESPRWLHLKGRIGEAETVIRRAASESGVVLLPFDLRPRRRRRDGRTAVATAAATATAAGSAPLSRSYSGLDIGVRGDEDDDDGGRGGSRGATTATAPHAGPGSLCPVSPFRSSSGRTGSTSMSSFASPVVMSPLDIAPHEVALEGVAADDDLTHFPLEPAATVAEATFYDLVRTPQARSISFPLWTVWTSFGFTYYGIIILVTRIYTTSSANTGGGTSPLVPAPGSSTQSLCSFDYESIFMNACAEFFGVLIAAAIIDRWGRPRTQAALYALGGVAVLAMALQWPSVALLPYVSMIARLAAMGSSCVTWVATSELYPTEMRATGHSVCSSLARAGAFAAPYFVISDASLLQVGSTLAFVNFLAAAVCMFMLPETRGCKLSDTATVTAVVDTPVLKRTPNHAYRPAGDTEE